MKRRAQSLIEYGIVICVIVAALAAMQVYIKSGYQGRLRGSADELSGGAGYSPGATYIDNTTDRAITEYTTSHSQGDNVTETKKSITESEVDINQDVRRDETTLPFTAEPGR